MLDDIRVHVKFKLFALWSALMFCYVYGDYFELYQPGKLQEMLSGKWAYGPVTQGSLLMLAALMAAPCLMGCVSVLTPARVSRWLNIFWGVVCTIIQILTFWGSWNFYVFFGVIDVVLTVLIVYFAGPGQGNRPAPDIPPSPIDTQPPGNSCPKNPLTPSPSNETIASHPHLH